MKCPHAVVATLVLLVLAALTAVAPAARADAAARRSPSAPTGATAWAGDATAFLRWAAPTAGAATVTGYTITPVIGGALRSPRRVGAAARAATITGLGNGSSVRFRIAATSPVGSGPSVETGNVTIGSSPLTRSSSWLDIVNYLRQTAGDGVVTASPAWTADLQAHMRYLAGTPATHRTGAYASAHTEDPSSPWFTPGGRTAAASADLLSRDLGSASANVAAWASSPFHAIGLIRPALRSSAYAAGAGGAGIDVVRGLDRTAPNPSNPVLLPGPGAITTLRAYSGAERPDPLESCAGFRSPGLPIVALLSTPPPAGTTATLRQPDGTTVSGADLCVITARNFVSTDAVYGASGRSVLKDSNAVVVIARHPLQLGRQRVTLIPAGQPRISWTFSVIAA